MHRFKWVVFAGVILGLSALSGLRLASSTPARVVQVQPEPNPEGFKQIAAPPSDFLNGLLQLPDPASLGLRSAYAMLPVTLEASTTGTAWNAEIAVDDTSNLQWILLAPPGSNWHLSLTPPQQSAINVLEDNLPTDVHRSQQSLGMGEEQYPATVISFTAAEPGLWRARITGNQTDPTQGFLVVSSASPYRLYTALNRLGMIAGQPAELTAYLYHHSADEQKEKSPTPLAATITRVEASLTALQDPRRLSSLVFTQETATTYRGIIPALTPGNYSVQVRMWGITPDGRDFVRTAEHLIAVVEGGLALGKQAQAAPQDAVRLRIEVPVTGKEKDVVVRASAEVWAVNAQGTAVPIAWISGLAAITQAQLSRGLVVPLVLDGHWIALARAQAPFELRNVRLQDRSQHVPLATVERMPLAVQALPDAAHEVLDAPTQEMLQGQRPVGMPDTIRPTSPEVSGVNHKLMLVHGYCSTDVWADAQNASQFTGALRFLDLNQNRTHDAFALLIRNFGLANLKTYGIVAHSQGGAASLHLYSTYWSGLDWVDFDVANGTRLIQSLGTPYQGTALAGSLAWIGNIFGVGCGENTDLTYDGAAAWLANIPSWARGQVSYYTTGEDSIWGWNSCTGADFLLDDPNDGVTENNYAQLSGANNLGYTDEQCHITGGPYMAQYHDASRNIIMNAAAKR